MRLMIVIQSLSGGGAERVAANLANYWARKSWEVIVVTLAPEAMDSYGLEAGVKRVGLDLYGASRSTVVALRNNWRRTLAVRRLLDEMRPSVVLSMMTDANVLVALASRGRPEICTVGSERSYPPRYPLGRAWSWMRRLCYGRLDAVVALTQESAAWLRANTTARACVVIPNGVWLPLPVHGPFVDVDSWCAVGRRIVLSVGRLSNEKGFDSLISAFGRVAGEHEAWDLVILGEGPERSLLERLVADGGLQGRVFLPGRAGNVSEWYQRADLYALSSRFEGFPNGLVEALCHGVPAISFDCDTGPRDVVRHNVDGLLVPPGDVSKLSIALSQVMGSESLRHRLSGGASQARERFSLVEVARRWEDLFRRVRKRKDMQ